MTRDPSKAVHVDAKAQARKAAAWKDYREACARLDAVAPELSETATWAIAQAEVTRTRKLWERARVRSARAALGKP